MRYIFTLALLLATACTHAADCPSTPGNERFFANSWGISSDNSRYQSSANTSITADNVDELELAWVFGFEDSESPHSYPLITEDTVYIGSDAGILYALERETGCLRWRFQADGDIRTAIVHGRVEHNAVTHTLLFFGTFEGSVYALNALSGDQVWQKEMDPHRFAMVTGTPVFHQGRLFVPVSSYELMVAAVPFYECCDFRGSVASLDAVSGDEIWRFYTIEDKASVRGNYWFFFDKLGPSGAPVWQSPAVDSKRNRLYFATGENYTDPATDTSDAVFALDLDSGELIWKRQFTEQDAYNAACEIGGPSCPESNGPDLDFGAPPILTQDSANNDILLAGQKSGVVHAMNPNNGEILWQMRAGQGGKLGGIHWGMAVNPELDTLFVPISDRSIFAEGQLQPTPGLYALSIDDGTQQWSATPKANCDNRKGCYGGFSAAITAANDLVFAGRLDGSIMAYRAADGEQLWYHDSWRNYESVSGVGAEGGPIDVHGPMVAADMMFISAGYSSFGQKGGNAFLAFRLRQTNQ